MSRLALIFALTLVFISPFASADIPHLISLQGKLTDASDNPISSSTNFVFRIYSSETGGTALWTEFQTIAPDTLGIFSALLGSATALNIPFNTSYWLEVKVNSEILSPRTRMGSAGYALRSESPWNTTGNNIYTTSAGNVGIGTTGPGEKLDINGNVRIANGGWLKFNAASDSGVDLGFGTQVLRMGSNGRMKFNSQNSVFEFNGNVGIGTASPLKKLDVVGDINATGSVYSGGAVLGGIPSGMIAFFASSFCPSGWTEYTALRGRAVVGLVSSGTVAGTQGAALGNLGTRTITECSGAYAFNRSAIHRDG